MKTPLNYQVTKGDCGTTSLINALVYLFEREEIPIEVVVYLSSVTPDKVWGEHALRGGTSAAAMRFLASWLSMYAEQTGFPLSCQYREGSEISGDIGGAVLQCIRDGGVAVTGCCLGADHYVLVTGYDEESDCVRVFDPYYDGWPLGELDVEVVGVKPVDNEPFSCNRLVERWILDAPAGTPYSLEAKTGRDAVLFWRDEQSLPQNSSQNSSQ
ncbi:MAG: hypothetical protein IJ125_02585 [Atopobiaceae bacterium]|nr:hypothetical protein [Atopobiaceae bacterium]